MVRILIGLPLLFVFPVGTVLGIALVLWGLFALSRKQKEVEDWHPPTSKARDFPRQLVADAHVAGISKHFGYASQFVASKERYLELEREPSNPHDHHAIKVFGAWKAYGSWVRAHLGYVPREFTGEIHSQHPDGPFRATIDRVFLPDDEKNPGVRFSIWAPEKSGGV